MNSLSSSPTKESMFINLVKLYSNNLKYAFALIGGKYKLPYFLTSHCP